MDPVSHAIFGQTLVTAVGRHPAVIRGRTIAAVLGALAPDVDAAVMPFGWDRYLRNHEIGTHTIAGGIVLACLVALLVRLFARRSRFIDLLWPAWVGCLSHVALDILSGAQVQIGWPLWRGRISLPLVAMAEPWLVAIFAAGAVAVALSRGRRRRTAAATLVIVGLFLGLKSIQLARALATLAVAGAETPGQARVIEARWASLSAWYVFDRQPGRLREWEIRAGGAPRLLLAWPITTDSPLATASRRLDTVDNFLAVHDLGFASEERQPDGGTRVLWSDLRYCWQPDAAAAADPNLAPILTRATATGTADLACGLWFGGSFDREGRPVRQLVKVGGWWQTRPPAR